jgi:3-oxoacyl-[acyl-carrier-protein] synthase II
MSPRGAGELAPNLTRMFDAAVPGGAPVNVVSAASGVADVTREEREALGGLIAQGRVATVRAMATMTGAAISATFPAAVGLAALAVKRRGFYRPFEADAIELGAPAASDRVVATSVGLTRGEGIGVVSAVP